MESSVRTIPESIGDLMVHLRSTCCGEPMNYRTAALQCGKCQERYSIDRGVVRLGSPAPVLNAPDTGCQVSLLILTLNEANNISQQLRSASEVLGSLGVSFELVVIDGGSHDGTVEEARDCGAQVFPQREPGYGAAFRQGMEVCTGEWVLAIDGDGSHDPNFIRMVWAERHNDLVIASRYAGGLASMPVYRLMLSKALNGFLGLLLSMPVKDLTSGFRLYKKSALQNIKLEGRDFNILVELLVRLRLGGFHISEVPFFYRPRGHGRSKVGLARFALSYLGSSLRLWRECRESPTGQPFPFRQIKALSPHRRLETRRTQLLLDSLDGQRDGILHLGAGPSKFLRYLPGAIGVDSSLVRLRLQRGDHPRLIQAVPHSLPFSDGLFSAIIVDNDSWLDENRSQALSEIRRVLKEGGRLFVWSRSEIELPSFQLEKKEVVKPGWRLTKFV